MPRNQVRPSLAAIAVIDEYFDSGRRRLAELDATIAAAAAAPAPRLTRAELRPADRRLMYRAESGFPLKPWESRRLEYLRGKLA